MAAIKMTFSLPEALARRFVRLVPSRERSKYLAAALETPLNQRRQELIEACEAANADAEVAAIEQEMDALDDPLEGHWNDAPAR
jgi:metal-responsive CopG/Arc/MetJ family transcriptional regulator